MNRIFPSATALALIFLAVASCSDNSITGPDGLSADDLDAEANRVIGSIQVTLGSDSLQIGKTTQATVLILDRQGRPLNRRVVWSSSNATIASVDTTGLVTALSPGVVSIVATHRLKSGSAQLTVTGTVSVDPVGTSASNEPTGMNLVSNRPFNLLHELGWDEPTNGQPLSNISIFADATAPKSPVNVMRFIYRAGTSGGSAPWDADSPPFAYKTVYVSHWARVSSNWQGHPGSSINKMYYLYTSTDVPSIVIVLWGANSQPLRPFIEGQNIVSGGQGSADPQNPDWGPNLVPTAEVKRGQWFNIEVVAKMNTQGNADGFIDLWLDGVHVTHVANVKFQNTPPNWRSLHLAPVWGGGGGTVANTMYMDFDNVYVSGKN